MVEYLTDCEATSGIKGWESQYLYTHNGFCVPLAAVKITFLHDYGKEKKTATHVNTNQGFTAVV